MLVIMHDDKRFVTHNGRPRPSIFSILLLLVSRYDIFTKSFRNNTHEDDIGV